MSQVENGQTGKSAFIKKKDKHTFTMNPSPPPSIPSTPSYEMQLRIRLFMRARGYTQAQIQHILSLIFPPALRVEEGKEGKEDH